MKAEGLGQVSDDSAIRAVCEKVIADNPKEKWLIRPCRRLADRVVCWPGDAQMRGKADAQKAGTILTELLDLTRFQTEERFLLERRESDAATIRKIIREARINPFSLELAAFHHRRGRSRQGGRHRAGTDYDGSRELASIAVVPACQGKGIATRIIERLLSQNPSPLYLTCRGTLGPFYRRFGFVALSRTRPVGLLRPPEANRSAFRAPRPGPGRHVGDGKILTSWQMNSETRLGYFPNLKDMIKMPPPSEVDS